MKRKVWLLWLIAAIGAMPQMERIIKIAPSAQAAVSVGVNVDFNFFVDQLSPHGRWVDASYGRCWIPGGVTAEWRPYTSGHWVWTDEYGWYWVPEEDWGWACFHYGRWAYEP